MQIACQSVKVGNLWVLAFFTEIWLDIMGKKFRGRIKIADIWVAGMDGRHKAYKYGGHPAPAGRALPNLLMRSEC